MIRHRSPRPLPRWARIAAGLVAVCLVCGIGAVATGHGRRDATTPTSASGARHRERKAPSGAWQGLEHAGIPVPGDWSAQRGQEATVVHGLIGRPEESAGRAAGGGYGAIDTALATVDGLTNPDGDDAAWSTATKGSLADDDGGTAHPLPDAPRWWWLQRRFSPAAICTTDSGYRGSGTLPPDRCDDDRWTGTDHEAVVDYGFYQPGMTGFPVTDDGRNDGGQDPQQAAARGYDTVAVPMDDGIWSITVSCPASALGTIVTAADGSETDAAKAGDGSKVRLLGGQGAGTRQHPCRTVEVVVGGEQPFWLVPANNGEDQQ